MFTTVFTLLGSVSEEDGITTPGSEEIGEFIEDAMGTLLWVGLLALGVFLFVWFISLPFRSSTSGLMPEGYVGVVYRFGKYLDKKTICPIDNDGNRTDTKRHLPWIFDRLYYRFPLGTHVIKSNAQWQKISSDPESPTSVVLDGVPIAFEIIGFTRIVKPVQISKNYNVRAAIEGDNQSYQARYEVAVKDIGFAVLASSITTVLSQYDGLNYENFSRQSPEFLDELSRRVDAIGETYGFRYKDIRFEKITPQQNIARVLAAPMLANSQREAALRHAQSMLGEGGEIDQIVALLRRQMPGATEQELRKEAIETVKLAAIRTSGEGYDLTMQG